MQFDPNLSERENLKQYLDRFEHVICFDLIVLVNKIRSILEDDSYYEPQAQAKIDAIETTFAEMGMPLNLDHPWNQPPNRTKRKKAHTPPKDA